MQDSLFQGVHWYQCLALTFQNKKSFGRLTFQIKESEI